MPYSWASGLSTDPTAPKAPQLRRDTLELLWPVVLGTVVGYVVLRILGIGSGQSLTVAAASAAVMTLCTEVVKARLMPPLPSTAPASGG